MSAATNANGASRAESPAGSYDRVDRIPPHDLRAERSIVGSIFCAEDRFAEVDALIRPEHLYVGSYRRVFEAAAAIHADGRTVDDVSLHKELERTGRWAEIGGAEALADLKAEPWILPRLLEERATSVIECWRQRQAIAIGVSLVEGGYAGTANTSSALDRLATLQPTPRAESEVRYGADLAEPLPPIVWLCQGLKLTTGSPTLAAGNAYSGKSLAWADVQLAVATGGDAFGVFRCRRGRAISLDYDGQGNRISQDRFQRLARARGVDLGALGNAIAYVRRPGFYLDDADATDRLCRLLDGFDLCVIDSWRGATPATDEWRVSVR